MARPFRFGVTASTARTGAEWAEQARRIEGLGYSTLFVHDHFADSGAPAPMVALSFAAAATTTLRVGMLVLGNDYRHPAVLAKDAATLDVMSDGRLEFGLGAGWMTADYEALGLRYDGHGMRIDRLAEALAVVNGAWGDGPFDLAGEHYAITAYDGLPKPLQSPRPPILVGGGGPKLLRLAGRVADIVGINPILSAGVIGADAAKDTLGDATLRKIGWVREGAGERFDDLELQVRYFVAAITDDARGLAEAMAPGFGVSPDEALGSGAVLAGTVDEVCDTLVARREEWGVSYVVFGDDQYEQFAPVVARLAGS
ncbi:MAG TPA: TIGR03621 family F420-dependent LLM class oxidoreductase [Acidimicrobiia bacterium]|jgi:probable F420-dependent oxidoreductase|nr:TIGR03621 family F420-dependent LLM class oxidoreductase [Acidimicrobiia bacterium]